MKRLVRVEFKEKDIEVDVKNVTVEELIYAAHLLLAKGTETLVVVLDAKKKEGENGER